MNAEFVTPNRNKQPPNFNDHAAVHRLLRCIYERDCDTCGGKRFVQTDGKVNTCRCLRMHRARTEIYIETGALPLNINWDRIDREIIADCKGIVGETSLGQASRR